MFTSVIQTYGLFLAFTFIIGGIIVYTELKRKYNEGLLSDAKVKVNPWNEAIINMIVGFIFGYKVAYIALNYNEFVTNAQDVVLSSKGIWWGGLLGAILLSGQKVWEAVTKKTPTVTITKKPHELIGDIVVVAAIFGILGSKIMALIEVWDQFMANPLEMLLSGEGIAIYGGLLGGFLGVYIYARNKGFQIEHLIDAAAPALLLGYGVGRLGCHFSGDGDWGVEHTAAKPFSAMPDWLWSYTYPNNVLGRGEPMETCLDPKFPDYCFELAQGVYPTSVYEMIAMTVLFLLFWLIRKRIKIAGLLFAMYLMVNGIERFLIETVRVNDRYEWAFNLTQAQIIAVGFFVTGAALGFIFWKRHQDKK